MKTCLLLLCVPGVVLAQGTIKPMWVNQLPSEQGRVYAMSSALISPSEAQAIKQAGSNAKGEVLARLRASVKATTDVRSNMNVQRSTGGPLTGSSTQSVNQATLIQAQALEVPGLAIAETWTDRKENTVYALAYLDVVAAQTELRNRYDAMQNDLANENAAGEPRERIRKLQRLKIAQLEMAKLDDLAGLLTAGGGEPQLRTDVRKLKLHVDKLLDQLRAGLTFAVGGDRDLGLGGDVGNLIRNAILKQGLGWAERDGEFTLNLRFQGARQGWDIGKKRWWQYQQNNDFIVARGVLEVTLVDRAGTQYESTTIEAKGVGTSEFQADRKLLEDYKQKLGTAISKWLVELTN